MSASLTAYGQMISTFVGNGTLGNPNDNASATVSAIGYPDGGKFDKNGNFYFTQVSPDKVCKVTPSGIINTVAGTITAGYNGDGIAATSAELYSPSDIAFDSAGNMYIADANNNRVRKVDVVTGTITTIAGNGTSGFGGDGGPASGATFNGIADICFDKEGNLYIADEGNNRIRKINGGGIVSTIAGTNTGGHSGDGGPATAADIEGVGGICVDAIGNLFLAETSDATVRKVNTSGIISTIAGNGMAGPSGDGEPATAAELALIMLVADNYGNLYISGYIDNDVRVIDEHGIIHTIAGTGTYGFSGDGGPATAAELSSTFGIALDSCGNIYVADKDNFRIRKIAMNPLCLNLGVENVVNNIDPNIYPNPAYDNINIDNLKTQSTYQLMNITGTVVQKGTLKEGDNSVSIMGVASGMYVLEVMDNDQQKRIFKIIKQ